MKLPNLSNSLTVARLRYIQSIHERPEWRNPDDSVKHFLPLRTRVKATWMGRKALSELRAMPFYYFLAARTRYYDQVIVEAVQEGVTRIVGVGCGTDTRAHRFASMLTDAHVRVLECDQEEAIRTKERMASRWQDDHVDYMAIDLNETEWPSLRERLSSSASAKTLVMLEGVSPYIQTSAFTAFLRFLATSVSPGSPVAYDYKIRGVLDDFGQSERASHPFRLPASRDEVAAFHEALGLRLESHELSSDLSKRLLPTFSSATAPLFEEDALVRLRVTGV